MRDSARCATPFALLCTGTWAETLGLNEEGLVSGVPMSAEEQERRFAPKGPLVREMEAALQAANHSAAEKLAGQLPCGKVHRARRCSYLCQAFESPAKHSKSPAGIKALPRR